MQGRDEIGYFPVSGQRPFYVQEPPGPGPLTSLREIADLTIAVLAIAVVFSLPQIRYALSQGATVIVAMLFYIIAIIAVIMCIITHEMAHKFTARSYGCWAEFRRNDFGLAIGVFTAFVGFGFIVLPGATYHKGYLTDAQNGKVSAAGPFTNAIIGYLCLPLALLLGNVPIVGYVLIYVVIVSALLGVFNMLPFGPLDGRKVWHWNAGIYLLLMAALVGLVVIAEYSFHFLGIL